VALTKKYVTILVLLMIGTWSGSGWALNVSDHPALVSLVDEMVSSEGFAREEVIKILSGAEHRQTVIDAMSKPAEGMAWHRYRKIFMTESRVEDGVKFWNQYRTELERAEHEYGVPAEFIVAIIGVESRFGEYRGAHLVLDSLVTLVIDFPRRSKFFSGELREYLVLCREEGFEPAEIKGSYAGAMGYPQFIASSYRAYAVDFSGDGKVDLINDPVDAIGSVANYFVRNGWERDGAVLAPEGGDGSAYAALSDNTLKAGLTGADLKDHSGQTPAGLAADQSLGIVRLEGEEGEIFRITLENFYVITRYNRSVLYAMAVYELSEEIRKNS
jgi:membrane-bound lytic murein transglycosylase B